MILFKKFGRVHIQFTFLTTFKLPGKSQTGCLKVVKKVNCICTLPNFLKSIMEVYPSRGQGTTYSFLWVTYNTFRHFRFCFRVCTLSPHMFVWLPNIVWCGQWVRGQEAWSTFGSGWMVRGSLDSEPTSSTFSFPFFGKVKWNAQTVRILSAEAQQTCICENPHPLQNMEGYH